MRKQRKVKRRSCALCHPYKQGWENRWRPAEAQAIHEFDSERREVLAQPVREVASWQL